MTNATKRRNIVSQTDLNYTASTGGIHHTLLGGAEIGRQLTDNFRNTGFFNNTATSISVLYSNPTISTPVTFRQSATDADNHLRTNVVATYVQDQVALPRHVQVITGLRFDNFDLQYHNNRNGDNLRRIDNLVSPRAGIVFKPVALLSIYGNYSVSYLPSSGDQFSSLTTITQQVKPERFNNYEVGVKWDVARRLALTTAVYRLDRTNTRSTDPNTNLPDVQFSFNSTGSDRFCTLTRDRVTHPQGEPENKIAIFIDKDLVEDANVQSEICGGTGIITGGFTAASAQALAVQLNSGALPGTISLVSSTEVGATLGASTVKLSLLAGAFGLAVVILFMLLYYRLPGVVASIALLLYAAIALAIFKIFGVTLTLAGLAGFILSVGMAVDANVLIFERVKEELRAGRTLGAAMEAGVHRAWPAIRDSNISTLITCFVLYFFGAPLIKGFAITLAIGVLVSMFSAIVTTQQFLQILAGLRPARRLALYGVQAPKAA